MAIGEVWGHFDADSEVRKLNSDGQVPKSRRVGGNVRWSTEEIQEWIRAGCPVLCDGQP